MKNNLFMSVIILILGSSISLTQTSKYPVAQPGYDGIFILLSNNLSSSFNIERSELKKNSWVKVGSVNAVKTSEEFVANFEYYSNLFPDLLKPQNSEVEDIWVTVQRTKTIDSLYFYGNSPVLRLALGVAFFDSSADRNKSYQYQIAQFDSASGKTTSHTTNEVKFPGALKLGKAVSSVIRAHPDNVFMQWRIRPNELLSSFHVYRQSNAKGEFEKVNVLKGFSNKADSVLLTVQDKTVEQNNFYKYFIVPTDLFGNRSESSDTVFCGIYNFASVLLPMDIRVESIDTLSALKLQWQIPAEQPVVSLQIFRSEYFDSAYTLLTELQPSAAEYLDQNIKPMQTYFYYFRLVGPMNEISPSSSRVFGFCNSSEVPIPPANVKVEALSNGVKLTWQNTENFIQGFWVYRSDGFTDSLRLISNLIKEGIPVTSFYDTTGLSGKLTYLYSIRSSSSSHILSDFSDTLAVRPNIKTNPPSPIELTGQIVESSAVLMWKNMIEIDSTVWGYVVFRRAVEKNKNSDFKSLTDSILSFNQNSFSDKTIKPGIEYEYQVITIDMYGGTSDPSVVSINFDRLKPVAPEGLAALQTRDGVELSWNESLQQNVKEYKVYRQMRDSDPKLVGTVKTSKEMKVIDKSLKKGELYFYFVTAVDNFDLESSASQIISFRP